MSNDTGDLPADYKPYRELGFCSNHFVNTPIAIKVEGHAPVLVGAGAGPHVWLSAPTGQDKRRWTLVVADNTPRVTGVAVRKTSQGDLEVLVADTKVLEVREVSSDTAAVTWLDLRPLGLDIHGDSNALWIGTNQFSTNRIENCNAAIGIGP